MDVTVARKTLELDAGEVDGEEGDHPDLPAEHAFETSRKWIDRLMDDEDQLQEDGSTREREW